MKTTKIISPYFENGVFAGVRVTHGDEDFVIAPKDYRDGKEMSWQAAMDALKADNLSTWNYRQICLTMAYRKEVDKVLVDNGGDSLDNWYWTCPETPPIAAATMADCTITISLCLLVSAQSIILKSNE